jgi:hypothetical protein
MTVTQLSPRRHPQIATVFSRDLDGRLNIVTAAGPDRGKAWVAPGRGCSPACSSRRVPVGLTDERPAAAATMITWRGLSHADLRVIATMYALRGRPHCDQ